MNTIVQVVCPYCGTLNAVVKEGFDPQHEVYLCDNEIGGCDLYFVVNLSVQINAFSQRIEGEVERKA